MATIFLITRDTSGAVGFGLPFSDQGARIVLGASSLQTFTVPTGPALRYLAIFSYSAGANVWVQLNGSALTLPSSSAESTQSELNPTAREVLPGDVIQLISSAADAAVSVKYYAL